MMHTMNDLKQIEMFKLMSELGQNNNYYSLKSGPILYNQIVSVEED